MYLFVYVHYLFHYLVVATFILVLKILPCLNKDFVSYRIVILLTRRLLKALTPAHGKSLW